MLEPYKKMESDWILIRVSAVVAAIVLPAVSAFSLSRAIIKSGLMRYIRCVAAYTTAVILVYFGYLFQGLITVAMRTRNFYSGWFWIKTLLVQYDYFSGVDTIVLISSIISFAVLFTRDYRSRVITAFRASFVTFMSFDILEGMVQGYAAEQYVMCAVFNIIGALLFGAVCAFCFERSIPLGHSESERPAGRQSASVPL